MEKRFGASRYLRFLVPGALILLLIIIVIKLGRQQQGLETTPTSYVNEKVESCNGRYVVVPTVAEIGSHYIVLGGNATRLSRGDTYQFGNPRSYQEIQLIDVDDKGATLIFENTTLRGEAGVVTPYWAASRCSLFVDRDDKVFMPHLQKFLLQQEDFDPGWMFSQYTEFVILNRRFSVQPVDSGYALLDTEHTRNSQITLPYQIWTEVRIYDTELVASEAFSADKRGYSDDLCRQAGLESQSAHYIACCVMHVDYHCSYIGMYDRYILYVGVTMPPKYSVDIVSEIPLEDWQYIVDLAEARLFNSISD